jgi:hypothetical protein
LGHQSVEIGVGLFHWFLNKVAPFVLGLTTNRVDGNPDDYIDGHQSRQKQTEVTLGLLIT